MQPLTQPQIYRFLDENDGRIYAEGVLRSTYDFESFLEAINFVNDVAEIAENLGHHPEILINYNKVAITTVTHDADDMITSLDLTLIGEIETLLN